MAKYRVRCDYIVEADSTIDVEHELVDTAEWIDRHLIVEEVRDDN